MRDLALKCYIKMQTLRDLLREEDGQDMVEYALVMGLIALGATVTMKSLAGTIGTAFSNIGTTLSTYTS